MEVQARREAEDGGVGAENLRSERVDLDGKELGVREGAGGGEEKAPGAGAGVDDPRGMRGFGGPGDHGIDDQCRRVDGSLLATDCGCPECEESIAKWILAVADGDAKKIELQGIVDRGGGAQLREGAG